VKQLPKLHYAGIDWATKTHAVCVVDQAGQIRARFQVPNTGKGFTGLIKRLGSLGVAGVAIERCDGPLVEAMLEADLRVVVVTPRQVKSLPSRYRASGAKSDPADAYVLADVLRTDGHRLAALTPDSEPTKIGRALSRTRKDLVEARSRWSTSSPASREGWVPGAIGCLHELHSPTAVAFGRRYPTGHAAALTQASLAALLRRLHYSGRTPLSELLRRLQAAPAAGNRPGRGGRTGGLRAGPAGRHPGRPPGTRAGSRDHRAPATPRRPAHLHQPAPHPATGSGQPMLLAELGDVRARFPTEQALAAQGGGRAGHHHLGQTPGRQVPLGLRQEATGGAARLRR